MFYYLLAQNCNMEINLESIASTTVIKYIAFITCVKIIEYKYLEAGFFNYYILAMIAFDIIFSAYHYINLKNEINKDMHYTDDITNDGFSISAYREDIENIRKNFLKRQNNTTHVHQPNVSKDATDYNKDNNSEINTDDLGHVVHEMLNPEKPNMVDSSIFNDTEVSKSNDVINLGEEATAEATVENIGINDIDN